ncbi:MAG: YqgE/AlgH family protein [Myxococcota bacterium]
MESLKGQLLISGGGLYDPSFRHTVVLLAEHDERGAVGIVLNRSLELSVEDAVPLLADLTVAGEALFEGGPVEPTQAVLLADVDDPEILDVPVLGTVGFLTGEVSAEVRPRVRRARVYVGHSGWGPGQLEAEMEGDSWILEPATAEDIFTDDPDSLWRRVLERKGPDYAPVARIPFDPSMN